MITPISPFLQALAITHLLSVSMEMPTLDIEKITYYVFFCVYLLSFRIMFSELIYIITCISIPFLFMAKQYTIVWIYHILHIHSSVDGMWMVSTFWPLGIMLLRTCMYKLCLNTSSICECIEQGINLLSHMVILHFTFWGVTKLHSTVAAPFYISISNV